MNFNFFQIFTYFGKILYCLCFSCKITFFSFVLFLFLFLQRKPLGGMIGIIFFSINLGKIGILTLWSLLSCSHV